MSIESASAAPRRIGIVLGSERLKSPAIKFFVLAMNKLQRSFEYEFLPAPEHYVLSVLNAEPVVPRDEIRPRLADLLEETRAKCDRYNDHRGMTTRETFDHMVVISDGMLSEEYYTMREGIVSVLALGNWDRHLKPPSLLEFIQALVVSESIAAVCPSLKGSVHFGTRGCLCDFTNSLEDARHKVLLGFMCASCRAELVKAQSEQLAKDVEMLVSKKWVGKLEDANSVTSILGKFGHRLFTTVGIKPTLWESTLTQVRSEGLKQFVEVLWKLVLALAVLSLANDEVRKLLFH